METSAKEHVLHAAAINAALVGTRFARRVEHFACVNSTNLMLLDEAANGAPEGTVYVAEEQTAGRGRGGHSWHSSLGEGLYLSALTQPQLPPSEALVVSLATGLAAQAAIHQGTGLHVDLRWPNDLLVGSRKCGGILVESVLDTENASRLRYAVIGIGINANHMSFPEELAAVATSLRVEIGQPVNRSKLLIALLRALDRELTLLEQGEVSSLLVRFAAASSWVQGKRVIVPEQGGYTGTTAGLDERGFLRVDCDDGPRRTVLSGGVREF